MALQLGQADSQELIHHRSGLPPTGQFSTLSASIISNTQNAQISGGVFSVIQGGTHYYVQGSSQSGAESLVWKILQAVPNFRKIYQDMLSKATEGTGVWLLENEQFRIWLEANGDIKIFWGSGMRTSIRRLPLLHS